MAEYIEREAVIAKLDELCRMWHYMALMPLFIDAIDSLHYYTIDNEQTGILKERFEKELADARPVKRGHWIETDYGRFYECSECGNIKEFERNFCDNCGADMREADATKG